MADPGRVPRRVPARLRDESGIALVVAIFALVVLAAVVAGGYFTASQEYQIGRGMKGLTASFYAGESGIQWLLQTWEPATYNALQPGESVTVGPVTLEGGGRYSASVVRVGSAADSLKRYFYIEAVGRPPRPGQGERRQAVIARARFPELCCDAAAQVWRNVELGDGGGPRLSGLTDDPPGAWPAAACAGFASDSLPGVIARDASLIDHAERIEGWPVDIDEDTAMTQAGLFDFGDLNFDDIAKRADHTFDGDLSFSGSQPTLVDGKCDRDDAMNWGAPDDPGHPCFDYFPIIHAKHDLRLVGVGRAQGILLVEQTLEFAGPFEFYGIALVKGELEMGGPARFYGGAYVAGDLALRGGAPRFRFSRCAADRAERLSNLAKARLLTRRAWVELF